MNKHIITLALSLLFSTIRGQAPQAVSYQAVATNAAGLELISSPIGIRASVVQGAINNPAQYIETFQTTTDTFGLFTINIGQGTYSGGTLTNFNQINWGAGPFFLKIEMDATGGTNYSFMGANQMLSVPYALYAQKADTANYISNINLLNDADTDSTNELQTLSINGDTLSISNGNSVVLSNTNLPYLPPNNLPVTVVYNGGYIDVSPVDNAIGVPWGPESPTVSGAHATIDGQLNTQAIVAAFGNNSGNAYAAKVCDTLTAYGYADWYLPTVNELFTITQQAFLVPQMDTYYPTGRWWWTSNESDYPNSSNFAIAVRSSATFGGSSGIPPPFGQGTLGKVNIQPRTRCIRHH